MHSPETFRRPFGMIFVQQVRAVGFALTREAMLAGAVLALICIASLLVAYRYDDRLTLTPELLSPTLMVAIYAPIAVWKGDPIFGRAYLWSLPAPRQQAAAAKVLAGVLWLMAAMLVTFLALALVALLSGGTVGEEGTRYLSSGSLNMADASRIRWSTPFWMWLPPFLAALLLYLASSALILGLRHPLRWLAGTTFAGALLFVVTVNLAPDGAIENAIEQALNALFTGRYGLDVVLDGHASNLVRHIDRPGPGSDELWLAPPDLGRWVAATLVWFGLTLLALALAIRRHWER
jgi:hypothetical protein